MARKSIKRKKTKPSQASAAQQPSRRGALRGLMWWGVGGAALLGGGSVVAMDFRKKLAEHDLSVIGKGVPVVMQIHDPSCGLCTALQKQARKAVRSFDEAELLFRVANIRTEEGAARQQREALPHVTLVLYDGNGRRIHVVEGVTPANVLIEEFKTHLGVKPT